MTVVPTDSLPTEIAVLAKQTIIESGLKVVPTDSLPMEITDGRLLPSLILILHRRILHKGKESGLAMRNYCRQ